MKAPRNITTNLDLIDSRVLWIRNHYEPSAAMTEVYPIWLDHIADMLEIIEETCGGVPNEPA